MLEGRFGGFKHWFHEAHGGSFKAHAQQVRFWDGGGWVVSKSGGYSLLLHHITCHSRSTIDVWIAGGYS